ncbi:hypothetical protein KC19_2G142800 [Ceratodon purpureus]|uniref:Uncharacterized protein n=1 Tax=Ceratodon purpureus TaxID=3225 RepID=A0A8T0IVG1_CERPU|nr:hypothetical protein KC19_2G142800 [Ceratodon purpureus]
MQCSAAVQTPHKANTGRTLLEKKTTLGGSQLYQRDRTLHTTETDHESSKGAIKTLQQKNVENPNPKLILTTSPPLHLTLHTCKFISKKTTNFSPNPHLTCTLLQKLPSSDHTLSLTNYSPHYRFKK